MMATLPRKFLMVHRDPPQKGYVVMLEVDGLKTRTLQLDEMQGEYLMAKIQDVVLDFAVQRGFVRAH